MLNTYLNSSMLTDSPACTLNTIGHTLTRCFYRIISHSPGGGIWLPPSSTWGKVFLAPLEDSVGSYCVMGLMANLLTPACHTHIHNNGGTSESSGMRHEWRKSRVVQHLMFVWFRLTYGSGEVCRSCGNYLCWEWKYPECNREIL